MVRNEAVLFIYFFVPLCNLSPYQPKLDPSLLWNSQKKYKRLTVRSLVNVSLKASCICLQ